MSWESAGGGERVEEEVELQGFLREEDWEEKGEREKKEGEGGRGDLEHQGECCSSPKGCKVQIEAKWGSRAVSDK